jgi:hypothetical protein
MYLLNRPNAMDEDNSVSTECAVGALGKVVYYQSNDQTLAKKFLSALPLKNEEEEAQNVHKQFFQMVLAKNANIIGFTEEIKQALERINTANEEEKEMELVAAEGVELMKQCVSLLI